MARAIPKGEVIRGERQPPLGISIGMDEGPASFQVLIASILGCPEKLDQQSFQGYKWGQSRKQASVKEE